MKKRYFLIIMIAALSLMNPLAMAESWEFAVFGDTRSNSAADSGVNAAAITAITSDISTNRNASFAIFVGDLVYGNGNVNSIATQLDNFKTAAANGGFKVAGTTGAGIPYYPVRGNHDNNTVDPLGVAWNAAFSTLPQNGPTTNTSGGGNSEVGMTYSFVNDNSLFLGLDEYINRGTYPNQVNQTWVDSQLSGSTAAHVFAFGHDPAYQVSHADCLAAHPTERDAFLTSLYDNSGLIYFAGHDHLTTVARANIGGDPDQVFYPVVIGAGGAPGASFGGSYPDPNVTGFFYNSTSSPTYYYTYSIVTVDADLVWLKVYGTASVATPNWLNLYALIASGTLTTNTNVLTSDTANDSTVNFNQSFDGVYSKVMTGMGNLVKSGAGKLTLSGVNTYSGTTTVNAGTLEYGVNDALASGAVSVDGPTATMNIATFTDTVGTVTVANGGAITGTTGVLTSTGTFEMQNGSVSAILDGAVALNKTTGGAVTLSGNNTYSGPTTITAGTLAYGRSVSSASAHTNNSILDLGANTLTLTGVNAYTQNAGATLDLTISGAGTCGNIVVGGATTVNAASKVYVKVPSGVSIASGTPFTIITTSGLGDAVALPTAASGNRRYAFTASVDAGGDLILTSSEGSFAAPSGATGNEAAVGNILTGIMGSGGDMSSVLDDLGGLSDQEYNNSLGTMTPDVSSGTAEGSRTLTGNSFAMVSNRLGGARSGFAGTGISSGEMLNGVGVWMQGLGNHLKQDMRKGIEGFSANTWGTTIGADKAIDNHVRFGLAGGYGWAGVHSKSSGSPSDDIDSFQGTLYGSYDSLNLEKARQGGKKSYEAVRSQVENSWYVDGMFAFTQNNYDSRREIWLGANKRVAKADHHGQQYSTNFETGYKFIFERTKALEITPFASLGYNYLYMNKYKEAGANALNLTVNGEGFHQLEQGLGTKVAYPITTKKVGTFIPSAKAAWLYDYIGDRFETTASFAGGGASFNTKGAKPAQNGMLFGAELAFLDQGNMTVTGNWDIELKDQFMSNTYYGTVRYDF